MKIEFEFAGRVVPNYDTWKYDLASDVLISVDVGKVEKERRWHWIVAGTYSGYARTKNEALLEAGVAVRLYQEAWLATQRLHSETRPTDEENSGKALNLSREEAQRMMNRYWSGLAEAMLLAPKTILFVEEDEPPEEVGR